MDLPIMELVEKHPIDSSIEECKGMFFRYRKNEYFSGGVYGIKETFTLLKRKSCPGCPQCSWIDDFLQEEFNAESGAEIPPYLMDMDLCELKVTNTSTDWESGLIDEITVGFVRVGR